MNLSLGTDFGPHDGTMAWEETLASYVGPTHPGHALVVAAGNSGDITTQGVHASVFVPPGVAHGFASLTDLTLTYLVDSYYNPNDELGLAWDDPDVAADWGISDPVLSARDQTNPRRSALDPALRPRAGLRT